MLRRMLAPASLSAALCGDAGSSFHQAQGAQPSIHRLVNSLLSPDPLLYKNWIHGNLYRPAFSKTLLIKKKRDKKMPQRFPLMKGGRQLCLWRWPCVGSCQNKSPWPRHFPAALRVGRYEGRALLIHDRSLIVKNFVDHRIFFIDQKLCCMQENGTAKPLAV